MPVEGIEGVVARARGVRGGGSGRLFFTGLSTQAHVEAVEAATTLPLMLGSAPAELQDAAWLAAHRVRIALKGHLPFQTMVQGIYEALKHHADGGDPSGQPPPAERGRDGGGPGERGLRCVAGGVPAVAIRVEWNLRLTNTPNEKESVANGNGYQEKSKIYLAQAHHELAMDDLSQASERLGVRRRPW